MTIATMPVPIEEASRFGIVIADESKKIMYFEEKPEKPRSNLRPWYLYFQLGYLKEALYAMKDQSGCDFGKHIIPYCREWKTSLHMNTTATGRMSVHSAPTGKQIWSSST